MSKVEQAANTEALLCKQSTRCAKQLQPWQRSKNKYGS